MHIVELNRDTGVMVVKDIRGETGAWRDRKVLARANALDHSDIQPLEPVPGRWLDERTYQIDLSYIRKTRFGQFMNSIVRTETIFGQVDFDGFVQWW